MSTEQFGPASETIQALEDIEKYKNAQIIELKESLRTQRLAAERANAELVKQQRVNKQLKIEKKKNLEEIKQLTDQLSIQKQELRVLGKRSLQLEPEEGA